MDHDDEHHILAELCKPRAGICLKHVEGQHCTTEQALTHVGREPSIQRLFARMHGIGNLGTRYMHPLYDAVQRAIVDAYRECVPAVVLAFRNSSQQAKHKLADISQPIGAITAFGKAYSTPSSAARLFLHLKPREAIEAIDIDEAWVDAVLDALEIGCNTLDKLTRAVGAADNFADASPTLARLLPDAKQRLDELLSAQRAKRQRVGPSSIVTLTESMSTAMVTAPPPAAGTASWLPSQQSLKALTRPAGLFECARVEGDTLVFVTRDGESVPVGTLSRQHDSSAPRISAASGTISIHAASMATGNMLSERIKQEASAYERQRSVQLEIDEEEKNVQRMYRAAFLKLLGETPPDVASYTTRTFSRCLEHLVKDDCGTELIDPSYRQPPIRECSQKDPSNPVHRLPRLLEVTLCLKKREGMVVAFECIFSHPSSAQRFRVWITAYRAMQQIDLYRERMDMAVEDAKTNRIRDVGDTDRGPIIKYESNGKFVLWEKTEYPPPFVIDAAPPMLLLQGPLQVCTLQRQIPSFSLTGCFFPWQGPIDIILQKATELSSLLAKECTFLSAKHAVQEAFYASKGLVATATGSIALADLRKMLEPEPGHPLHSGVRFLETTATFLRGVGLRLDENIERVCGIAMAPDPGHRPSLIQGGYYKPKVGLPQMPALAKTSPYATKAFPGNRLTLGRFIDAVGASKTHQLELTERGVCPFDHFVRCYEEFYTADYRAWREAAEMVKLKDAPKPPVQDELDEELLARFHIFRTDYVDGKGSEMVVVSGFRVRPVTTSISHMDNEGRMNNPGSAACCIM